MAETMDRGSDALKNHITDIDMMDVRQVCRRLLRKTKGTIEITNQQDEKEARLEWEAYKKPPLTLTTN